MIYHVSCFVIGESILSPGAKQGLIPLAIPLSKNSSGMAKALHLHMFGVGYSWEILDQKYKYPKEETFLAEHQQCVQHLIPGWE